MDLRGPVERRPLRFLSRPSGAVRARALAAGVPLPPAGSFRDAVMQEVLFRQRNLRHVEMTVMVSLAERLGHILLDAVYGPAKDAAQYNTRHAPLRSDVDKLLKLYEAEVFEDRYLPAYQQAEAEEERKAKIDAMERERREAAARKKVAAFSEEEPRKT